MVSHFQVFSSILGALWNFGTGVPLIEVFGTARGAAKKIFYVLDSKQRIHQNKNIGTKLSTFQSSIAFKDVHFNYPSRPDVKASRLHVKIMK